MKVFTFDVTTDDLEEIPDRAARVLLTVIDRDPEAVERALAQ